MRHVKKKIYALSAAAGLAFGMLNGNYAFGDAANSAALSALALLRI